MPSLLLPTTDNIANSAERNQSLNISNNSSSSQPTTKLLSSANSNEAFVEPEHEHASIVVFINGNLLNFSHPKFQNQDLLMHFEDGDSFTIHKHAKKVGLDPSLKALTLLLLKTA
jgi:hypothetical protein